MLALSYRDQGDLEIRYKGVLDWVTEADIASGSLKGCEPPDRGAHQ